MLTTMLICQRSCLTNKIILWIMLYRQIQGFRVVHGTSYYVKYQCMSLVIKCIVYLFWTLKFFLLKFELSGLNTRHLGNKNETSPLEQATLYFHFCVTNGQNASYIKAARFTHLIDLFLEWYHWPKSELKHQICSILFFLFDPIILQSILPFIL